MATSDSPARHGEPAGSFSVECVASQVGKRYILVTQGDTHVLLPRSLFVGPLQRALDELAKGGIELVLPDEWKTLRRLVAAARQPTRTILVADRPGWITSTAYAYPDGTVVDGGQVVTSAAICTFQPNPGFRSRGTLQQWQSHFGPLLQQQTLLQGLVCLGWSAPLLTPLGEGEGVTENPMVALVGASSTGKTTALMLIGSLTGVSPMETWATTANALEETFQRHADGALVIDEILLAGGNPNSRDALLTSSAMMLAIGRGKARMNQPQTPAARFILVTTANSYIVTNARNAAANDEAVQVRVLAIDLVGREHGILDVAGDGQAARTIEAIRHGTRVCGGPPMRRFIARLSSELARDPKAVRRMVAQATARFRAKAREMGTLTSKDERILPRFALAYAAGALAQAWSILPQEWSRFGYGVLQLFRMAQASLRANAHSDPIARFELGLAGIKARLIDQVGGSEAPPVPNPIGAIRRAASGHIELLMRRGDFNNELGHVGDDLLRRLRDSGALATEVSEPARTSRFTVKRVLFQEGRAERVIAVRLNGRVYPEKIEVQRIE